MKGEAKENLQPSHADVGPFGDATAIAQIWPKLTPEQQAWIKDLSPEERLWTDNLLQREGEAYFLTNFTALKYQLEYVRTL